MEWKISVVIYIDIVYNINMYSIYIVFLQTVPIPYHLEGLAFVGLLALYCITSMRSEDESTPSAAVERDIEREAIMTRFLAVLEKTLSVRAACSAVNKPKTTVYQWKGVDRKFAQGWESALDGGIGRLEKTLTQRAELNETGALLRILESKAPEDWSRRTVVEGGDSPLNIRDVSGMSAEELGAEILALESALAGPVPEEEEGSADAD